MLIIVLSRNFVVQSISVWDRSPDPGGLLRWPIKLAIPVAFSLAGVTLIFAGIGVAMGEFSFVFLQALPQRGFGVMQNFTLLAVPFFIFMGMLLERARLAEDLLHTAGLLFGTMRDGVAIAVIAVGALLAAPTGVVGATVVAMGG